VRFSLPAFERMFCDGGGGEERQTKPLPQPLSEERGEWLAMEMEEVILGLIGGGDSVDI